MRNSEASHMFHHPAGLHRVFRLLNTKAKKREKRKNGKNGKNGYKHTTDNNPEQKKGEEQGRRGLMCLLTGQLHVCYIQTHNCVYKHTCSFPIRRHIRPLRPCSSPFFCSGLLSTVNGLCVTNTQTDLACGVLLTHIRKCFKLPTGWAKASVMRISITLDLSSRSFIPLPRFVRSRCPIPFLTPSLVLFHPRSGRSGTYWVFILELFGLFYSSWFYRDTFFTLGFRLFLFCCK